MVFFRARRQVRSISNRFAKIYLFIVLLMGAALISFILFGPQPWRWAPH